MILMVEELPALEDDQRMKTGRTLIDPGGIGPGGCVPGQLARARRLECELVASSQAGVGNVRGELDARPTYKSTPRVLGHVPDRGEIAVLAVNRPLPLTVIAVTVGDVPAVGRVGDPFSLQADAMITNRTMQSRVRKQDVMAAPRL